MVRGTVMQARVLRRGMLLLTLLVLTSGCQRTGVQKHVQAPLGEPPPVTRVRVMSTPTRSNIPRETTARLAIADGAPPTPTNFSSPTIEPPPLSGTILFSRTDVDGADRVFALSQGRETPLPIVGYDITVSPDGIWIVARQRRPDHQERFVSYNTKTGEIEELPLTCPPVWCQELFLASDGITGALTYHCGLEETHIIIARIDRLWDELRTRQTEQRCLEGSKRVEGWFASGEGLLTRKGGDLYVHDLDGQERLVMREAWGHVHIASDGRTITLLQGSSAAQTSTLVLVDRETLTQRPIPIPGYQPNEAVLSPDQQWVIFSEMTSHDRGQCLYLVDVRDITKPPRCLTKGVRVYAWLRE